MTRKEAIELALKACKETWNEKTCKKIRKALEQEWIPVSERLPEKESRYLTTILNEHDNRLRYVMTCDYFSNGCWCPDDECASSNVIAWMPLPPCYEPQESEDKCKNCKYYSNPDYERCHKCKAESEG